MTKIIYGNTAPPGDNLGGVPSSIEVQNADEYAALDALPAPIRQALNYSMGKWSAQQITEMMETHGVPSIQHVVDFINGADRDHISQTRREIHE